MLKTWQIVLATIGIFVAGLVTGSAVTFRGMRYVGEIRRRAQERAERAFASMPAQSRPPMAVRFNGQGEPRFGPQLVRRFIGELDLSKDQLWRVDSIVNRTVSDLNHLRRETQLSTALAMERMQDEIADQLTSEQRSKFDDLLKQQRARLHRFIQERQQQQQERQQQQQERQEQQQKLSGNSETSGK